MVDEKTDKSNQPASALWMIQLVSNKPVETVVYTSNLVKQPIFVGTEDRQIWRVENGKIKKSARK